jgi:hypothetical protein
VYYSDGTAAHALFDEAARAVDGRFPGPTKLTFRATESQLIIVKRQEIPVLSGPTSIKTAGQSRPESRLALAKARP